jgi:hypothetical protein
VRILFLTNGPFPGEKYRGDDWDPDGTAFFDKTNYGVAGFIETMRCVERGGGLVVGFDTVDYYQGGGWAGGG